MIDTTWVVRSLLFVPGHVEDMIVKAARSQADCLALDLQDGVPPDKKGAARKSTREALESRFFQHKRVLVRLNHPTTELIESDIDGVACAALDGFVYPMASTPQEIIDLDSMLSRKERKLGLKGGHFALFVLIETPLGLLNAYEIARASRRVVGLLFGAEDYLAAIHGQYDATNLGLHTPRALIVVAARAAGVEAIDTPYPQVHDPEGLEVHARQGRVLGMSGMLVLSPRQIPVVHAIYTPSETEIHEARKVVQLAEEAREAGRSYTIQGDQLVSPSREKKARAVLARFAAIQSVERSLSGSGIQQEA